MVFSANDGTILAHHQEKVSRIFPHPGWVEQSPDEIFLSVRNCINKVSQKLEQQGICPKVQNWPFWLPFFSCPYGISCFLEVNRRGWYFEPTRNYDCLGCWHGQGSLSSNCLVWLSDLGSSTRIDQPNTTAQSICISGLWHFYRRRYSTPRSNHSYTLEMPYSLSSKRFLAIW